MNPGETAGELRAVIGRASELVAALESDRNEVAARLVDSENQLGRLMSLYVATYQLHITLDPNDVHETIADIAVNLLGAEEFALLLKCASGRKCDVVRAAGLATGAPFAGGSYVGGDPIVDTALSDGTIRLGEPTEGQAVAAVPFTVQGETVGALVIVKLFDHKEGLRPDDRDILDLLAAHAASAIVAARVYSTADRKLRTLEGLLDLAHGR